MASGANCIAKRPLASLTMSGDSAGAVTPVAPPRRLACMWAPITAVPSADSTRPRKLMNETSRSSRIVSEARPAGTAVHDDCWPLRSAVATQVSLGPATIAKPNPSARRFGGQERTPFACNRSPYISAPWPPAAGRPLASTTFRRTERVAGWPARGSLATGEMSARSAAGAARPSSTIAPAFGPAGPTGVGVDRSSSAWISSTAMAVAANTISRRRSMSMSLVASRRSRTGRGRP